MSPWRFLFGSRRPARTRLLLSPSVPLGLWLAMGIGVICGSTALATTVVSLDGQQLVDGAQRIVHARCTHRSSYRDDAGRIVTRYEFATLDALKGDPGDHFSYVVPGGRVGRIATLIPGLSSHEIGDELILFLGPRSDRSGFEFPVGLDQGVFRVALDEPSQQRVVIRRLDNLEFAAPRSRPPGSPGASTDARAVERRQLPEHVPVEAFKTAVRTLVSTGSRTGR